jgi:CPA2 family monovalent cation:H+ antiporter-2
LTPAKSSRYSPGLRRHASIIVGFGLNGGNLAKILRSMGIEYVVLELNSKTVRSAKRKGEPIFYGDGTSVGILHKLGIHSANILVIAISDAASTRRIVQLARAENRNLHIIVRTRYVAEVEDLKALGANEVIPEEFETSIEIFSKVLHRLHIPLNDIREHIDRTRSDNYLALRTVKLPQKFFADHEELLRNIAIETYRIRPGSVAEDNTLMELSLRSNTGVTVIGIERQGIVYRMPSSAMRLMADDVLLFIGKRRDIDCAMEFLDSSPDKPVQCPVREDEPDL